MFHCSLKIAIIGFSSEIFDYLNEKSSELFGAKYTVEVARYPKINGKIIAESNVIFAEINEGIEDVLLMYSVSKKADTYLILTIANSQRAKLVNNPLAEIVHDVWPYGIEKDMFMFKYERFVKFVSMEKEKWLTETYLENVIDSTDDLIWFKDKVGMHLKVNDSFCQAVNKTKEQISGRGHYYIWDITPEEYVAGEFVCMESEYEVMSKKTKCWFDEDVLIHDEMRKLRTCKSPLFDFDGSVMGTVGVAKDVTREIEYKSRLRAEVEAANHAARTDAITGMSNRLAYSKDLNNYGGIFPNKDFIYVAFDIDGLKKINEESGYEAGDELIKATSECIDSCFGAYGRTYRISGDEFVAMINADKYDMLRLFREFDNAVFNWSGELNKSLSVSYGYAVGELDADNNIFNMAKEANRNLYAAKLTYYERKGIDLRSKQEILDVMLDSYIKVLKVNLSSDACVVFKVADNEFDVSMGFDEQLTEWVNNFVKASKIHADDVENFKQQMNISNLRDYFKNNETFSIKYRRITDGEFVPVLLEIVRAKEYSDDNQIVYLYIKKID